MNGDFFERAKRQAQVLGRRVNDRLEKERETLSPQVRDALEQTQVQAEHAIGELAGLVKKAAKAVRDDINSRPDPNRPSS